MPAPARDRDLTVPLYQFDVSAEDEAAVVAALRAGHWADGPPARALEQAFAAFLGGPEAAEFLADPEAAAIHSGQHAPELHTIATSSGTAALHALCHACLQPGDYVLTTPLSFVATTNAVRAVGAVPCFSDVEPDTGNLDPVKAARWLEQHPETRAILLVHLYGQPCRLDAFRALADEYGVLLLEDCAQAAGATWHGQPVGTFGDAAAFSLYATKNLAAGEGGIVVTRDDRIAANVRQFINHGRTGRGAYEHDTVGLNMRMSGLAAALAHSRLPRLASGNAARQRHAAAYHDRLADLAWLALPPLDAGHVYHQFVVRTRWREELQRHLATAGIETAVHYPVTIPDQPAYRAWVDSDIPIARQLAQEVLSLPVRPCLTAAEHDAVCQAVTSFTPPEGDGDR